MINVHVLYEHSGDNVPHGSSMIRLLRPIGYPSVSSSISLTYGTQYRDTNADIIIIDRLWTPGIDIFDLEDLVNYTRKKEIKLVYSIDDNLLDLNNYEHGYPFPTANQKNMIRYLLRETDAILVSTQQLLERFKRFNKNITVIENYLDERLIPAERRNPGAKSDKIKFGYMGTPTHDKDFREVLLPIQKVLNKYNNIEFEFVGAIRNERILRGLHNARILNINGCHEYMRFWNWMKEKIHWDFAIAPLRINEFTKCKSDIKFLDYAALKIPGIFTKSPAYECSVLHEKNGILVENNTSSWTEALEMMITDVDNRLEFADNARRYLELNRILKLNSIKWLNFINKIV